jgi:hypothetical protein
MKASQLIPHVPTLSSRETRKEQLRNETTKKTKEESFKIILQTALK